VRTLKARYFVNKLETYGKPSKRRVNKISPMV
jgi:hypothetical protein